MAKNQKPTKRGLCVTAGQATQVLEVLQKLLGAAFPAVEAFKLAHLTSVLSSNPTVVATDKTRVMLFRKHGVEKDGGLVLPPENLVSFIEEFTPIAEAPIHCDGVDPLPLSILEHAPSITPAEAMALTPFMAKE